MSLQEKSLQGKTLFITGASRGIGLAIGLRAARDGANVAIAAKTTEPHPKLPGTIYTAAEEIERAGGKALPLVVDVRDEAMVKEAIDATAARFGGLDIVVNNASAISLTPAAATDMKRYDLMQQINTRGTFVVSKWAIPHLQKAANPHILMISPPLDMKEKWFAPHTAYTIAKFGMSLVVLGLAGELRNKGIAVNALWPRTVIATAAVNNLLGGEALMRAARKPEIMADAAYAVFAKPAREFTGNFLIDDTFLSENGVTDFEPYRVDPAQKLVQDFFVPDSIPVRRASRSRPVSTNQPQGRVMAHGAVPHFHGHRRCLIARDRRFGGSGAIADRRRRRAETVKTDDDQATPEGHAGKVACKPTEAQGVPCRGSEERPCRRRPLVLHVGLHEVVTARDPRPRPHASQRLRRL